MATELENAMRTLGEFHALAQVGARPAIDRPQVVAHATLSGFAHHWPSRVDAALLALLEATSVIKEVESSRWIVQRRIAVAKLARALDTAPSGSSTTHV
ncbi:MAG: hypothetical protein P4M08_13035 [Oligoflexia bacterium]|nr:hypothetical protein [Oligoflexia bacterium]